MSTKAEVRSGICGFKTVITATKGEDKKFSIAVESECEQVSRMQDDIGELDLMAAFIAFVNNPVYRSASKNLKHVACPVPSGILKALEIEAGLCLPKEASIVFEVEDEDGKKADG